MALLISKAILHTVGNNETQTHYSDVELEVDSETCIEFVGKHVRKLLRNPSAKEATFTEESPVHALVKSFQRDEIQFKDLSRRLCERLAEIMKDNGDIAPADVLVTFFDNGKHSYIAIVKLNYGECFTNKLTVGYDGKTENRIVKNTMVLPLGGGNVEEACLIPYDPMVLRILEKPHTVNGEEICYFSEMFLDCITELSKKETAEAIQEIADEINVKYFDGNVEMAAKMKTALMVEAEIMQEDDGLVLENVVDRVFGDNTEAKDEFVHMAKEYGLPHQIMMDTPFVKREFKMQRFKAENGVELKFPSELIHDPDQLQMVTNPDGSTTITLKNLRPAEL